MDECSESAVLRLIFPAIFQFRTEIFILHLNTCVSNMSRMSFLTSRDIVEVVVQAAGDARAICASRVALDA